MPVLSSEADEVAAASPTASVRYRSTSPDMLPRQSDRRRQLHAGLAHRRKQAVYPDRPLARVRPKGVADEQGRPVVSQCSD